MDRSAFCSQEDRTSPPSTYIILLFVSGLGGAALLYEELPRFREDPGGVRGGLIAFDVRIVSPLDRS